MTKSQNTKSEQLTEQWKKGELPEETECYVRTNGGIYLGSIRYKNGRHNKKLPYVKSFDGQFITKHIEQVLVPVPSYDELQNMNDAVNECMAANIKLVEENKNLSQTLKASEYLYTKSQKEILDLKELLKECKVSVLNLLSRNVIECNGINQAELLVEIDEVLNADKA